MQGQILDFCNPPLTCFSVISLKAHCLKATALSKAGRNDEALQEYLLCVALKPDWTKVKLETQKVRDIFSQNTCPIAVLKIHFKVNDKVVMDEA